MSRGDTPGNGRALPRDWPSVRARLLQHAPHGASGNRLVSVRVSDIQHVCRMVDDNLDVEDQLIDQRGELEALRYRTARAVSVLTGGAPPRPPKATTETGDES